MSSNHPSKNQYNTTPGTAKKDEKPATTTSTTTNQNKENQPSLLTRIQNSASSLVQDTITRPSGASLSSDFAHILDSGSKGSSSGHGSSGASTYSGQTRRSADPRGSNLSSAAQNGYASGMSDSFRSTHLYDSAGGDLEIDSFQNTGFFSTVDDPFMETNEGKGKNREQPIYDNHSYHHDLGQDMVSVYIDEDYESTHFNAYETAWINASRLGTVYRSTTSTPSKRLSQSSEFNSALKSATDQNTNQKENDGAEVVTLLSDPSFQPGLVTWDDDSKDGGMDTSNTHDSGFGFESNDDDDDDAFDAEGFPLALGLSPAEMQIIDLFRRQPHHQEREEPQGKKKITPYSLVPDIDSFLTQHQDPSTTNAHEALRNEVITSLIGAEEWLHVDERYNDDVWGYLRPAVEAAAAEIQEKEQNPVRDEGDGDGPAVKRLRMILRHMAHL